MYLVLGGVLLIVILSLGVVLVLFLNFFDIRSIIALLGGFNNLGLDADVLRSIASIATVLISTLNIILVIVFYFLGRKNYKEENILNKKSYWFRNVILEPNIEKLENYFKEIHKVTDNLEGQDDDYYSEAFVKFKELTNDVNSNFLDLLKVMDTNLAEKIEQRLIDFEDEFVDLAIQLLALEKEKGNDQWKVKKLLNERIEGERYMILKIIYAFEFSNYESVYS